MRKPVSRSPRMQLSTCSPKNWPGTYWLNSGGKMWSGTAAETNRVLAASARRMRSPSCRAVLPSGGSCSFFFTSADCDPAVERPSSQLSAAMMRRKSATSSLLRTSGMQINMDGSPVFQIKDQAHIDSPAGSDLDERLRTLVQGVVIRFVGEVLPIEFQAGKGVDSGLGK